MKRLRLWLASVITPCECETTYDRGEAFIWCNTDADLCRKRGHESDHKIVGSTST